MNKSKDGGRRLATGASLAVLRNWLFLGTPAVVLLGSWSWLGGGLIDEGGGCKESLLLSLWGLAVVEVGVEETVVSKTRADEFEF